MKYRASLVGTDAKEATMGMIEAESAHQAIARAEAAFPSPSSMSYYVSLVDPTSEEELDELSPEDSQSLSDFSEDFETDHIIRKIDPEPVRRYPIFQAARLRELKKWSRTAREFEWFTEIRKAGDDHVLFVGWTPIQSPEEWEFFQRKYLATPEAMAWTEHDPEASRFRELDRYPWVENLRPEEDEFDHGMNQSFFWDDDDDDDIPF
jgi:hypothetical protein